MKSKLRKLAGRIVLIATLCLLVVSVLASCGGNSAPKLTRKGISTNAENGMDASELEDIADLLIAVYSAEFDTREMLVAASRGYDMTDKNFNDAEATEKKPFSLDAAKNVITEANNRASAEDQVGTDYLTKLNEKDVDALIRSFQTKVDLNGDGGFFDTILTGIGEGLRWMTNTLTFGSYLAGICVFAVIIEILMLPFAIKQQKNTIRQAKLRPKEMAIRNKYKGRNDQVTMQKMQQEIQEFYQRENFSPYSGCLPLLIQFPIIIALYNIVIDPLRYVMGQASGVSTALESYYSAARAAGGLGGSLGGGNGTIAILADIKNKGFDTLMAGLKDFAYLENGGEIYDALAAIVDKIPRFTIGGINFGLAPSFERFDILLLVPVLTFGAYFLTSKLNRKFMYQPAASGGADARQVACSNTMMDVTMPLMSTVFTFMVPALVGVYWIFRSLVGLLKQFIISKAMPVPTFTEEDYKQAAKEMAGKKVVTKSANAGKVRSLHYIDDEDFEDTRERALARKAAIEERERAEQEQKAKNTPFSAMPMKKDERKKGKDEKNEKDPENDNENE